MGETDNVQNGEVRDRKAGVGRLLRRYRALLFTVGAVLGAVAFVLGGSLVLAGRPSSCATCHEMQPHYDQWATSTHKGVICIDCHTEPGLAGIVKIEAQMLENSLVHVARAYDLPIRADVRDDSCLRCHPKESRPEVLPQATLRIAHSAHDGVPCAECHGRLVHTLGQEVTSASVTHKGGEKACQVCHTPEVCPHGSAEVDCASCHSANIPLHSLREQTSVLSREGCIECHNQERVAPEENCQTCHVSPHGIDRSCNKCHTSTETWHDKTLVHPFSLEGGHAGAACTKCHNEATRDTLSAACSTCHQPKHQPYGDNDCSTCHSTSGWKPATIGAAFDHGKVWENYVGAHTRAACSSCHKDGVYAGISTACSDCHQSPQPHFGTDCVQCHKPTSPFKRA